MIFYAINPAMLDATLSVFAKVASPCASAVGAVFMCRLMILATLSSAPESYFRLFKDVVLFFACLTLFPEVFRLIILGVDDIAGLIAAKGSAADLEVSAIDELLASIKSQMLLLAVVFDLAPLSIGYIAQSIFSVLIGLICAVTPVILLINFITGTGIGVSQILSLLLIVCVWPILWNILGLLAVELTSSDKQTSLASFCFRFVVQILQFISPVLLIPLLKSAALQPGIRQASSMSMPMRVRIHK